MPRKRSEAVPEGNGPTHQQEEFRSGEPTLADIYRLCEESSNRMDSFRSMEQEAGRDFG